MKVIAEYLWLDGKNLSEDHEDQLSDTRGKTKVFDVDVESIDDLMDLKKIPIWGFDGSSTMQANGDSSDCVLKPVRVYADPLRSRDNTLSIIVLNEVFTAPGEKEHPSNTRAALRAMEGKYAKEKFWFGIEQEYTLMRAENPGQPFGFPEKGEPSGGQGKYYCGVGVDKIFGRMIAEEHMMACLDAGILIAGVNAEVMPGQWEYQVGNATDDASPLKVADDLIVARYVMDRLGEKHGIIVSLDPKPVKGWNGAGDHINWSNLSMRERLGKEEIEVLMGRFREAHDDHISIYGNGIKDRLTGDHETCDVGTFRYGVSDRGASIRIPWQVDRDGNGYLEDRRPCANIDPYQAFAKEMETTMGK